MTKDARWKLEDLESCPEEDDLIDYRPEYMCTDCGSTGSFSTVTYDTPCGYEYDLECDICASTEVDEF